MAIGRSHRIGEQSQSGPIIVCSGVPASSCLSTVPRAALKERLRGIVHRLRRSQILRNAPRSSGAETSYLYRFIVAAVSP